MGILSMGSHGLSKEKENFLEQIFFNQSMSLIFHAARKQSKKKVI